MEPSLVKCQCGTKCKLIPPGPLLGKQIYRKEATEKENFPQVRQTEAEETFHLLLVVVVANSTFLNLSVVSKLGQKTIITTQQPSNVRSSEFAPPICEGGKVSNEITEFIGLLFPSVHFLKSPKSSLAF